MIKCTGSLDCWLIYYGYDNFEVSNLELINIGFPTFCKYLVI